MSTIDTSRYIDGFDSAGVLASPEEFDSLTEEDIAPGYRYQLINGVLVVNPLPSNEQVGPNELLGGRLFVYKHQHAQGFQLDATLPERHIYLPNGNRRIIDRALWCGLGRQPETVADVPTIAVEFVSAGKRNQERDYELKRDEYREAGVTEYWIIDRFQRCMTIHRYLEGSVETLVVGENDVYQTELLPGFELPLAELLAEADRWAHGTST